MKRQPIPPGTVVVIGQRGLFYVVREDDRLPILEVVPCDHPDPPSAPRSLVSRWDCRVVPRPAVRPWRG